MYFHWQNLNEKPGNNLGNPFMHLRFWIGDFGCEWKLLTGSFGIRFSVGVHHAYAFNVSLLLFSLYLNYERLLKLIPRITPGEFNLSIHDSALWFTPWGRPMEWRSQDVWWRKGKVFRFDDRILGRAKHWTELLEKVETFVPMPEGSYPAVVTLELACWKRPRWFKKSYVCATVEVKNGIPHEGKGENLWDCGEDATYSLSCEARTVEQAVAKMVESVLRSRRRYGTPKRIKPVLANVTTSTS